MQVVVLNSWVLCLEGSIYRNKVEPQVAILNFMLAHFTVIGVAAAFIISQALYMCWITCPWTQIPDKAA